MANPDNLNEPLTPAAAWMDRLSDRIGAFVPGCERLGPRHPIKVSLVMGALGFLSGAVLVLVWSAAMIAEIALDHPLLYLFLVLLSLSAFGVFVFTPLSCWLGRRWQRIVSNVIVSIIVQIAGLVTLMSMSPRNTAMPPRFELFALLASCAVISGGFAIWTTRTSQRNRNRMLTTTIVAGTITGIGFVTLIFEILAKLYEMDILDPTKITTGISINIAIIFGACLAAWYSILAICLGIALWDATPRPKSEPDAGA